MQFPPPEMPKKRHDEALSARPVADKVVAKMRRRMRSKVVNIKNVIDGRAAAEGLYKTVVTQKELAGLDPAHAAYVYTRNQVSGMSEQLTALKEMAPLRPGRATALP